MSKNLSWKQFKTAVQMEIKEHKSSFWVYTVLRTMVIVVLVRQFFLRNYESVFFCLLTLVLLYLPSLIQVRLRIELPTALEIIVLCFIFAAEILGEISAFYTRFQGWDTILHTLNGFLCAAIGFSLVMLLNDNDHLTFDLSPLFMAVVAFCFSMTIGVLWEFFECGMDLFFHSDMQKDTIVNSIYTVSLDPTNSNKVIAIPTITDVAINGQALGLGGYLDIGLLDTMKDMFVNFIGALVFSFIGFFYVKSRGQGKVASSLIPSRKAEGKDYLQQVMDQDAQKQADTPPKKD